MSDILMVRRLTVNEFVHAVGGSIPSRSKRRIDPMIRWVYGHVAERFNAPYLKYDVLRYHEFESHPVRPVLITRSITIVVARQRATIYRNHQ